jgi:hypothetical protein
MRILAPFLFLVLAAPAQLTKATGDEFTVLVFHDIHVDTAPGVFHNSVDWLLGTNGRGPGGVSGISYYNIKSISGVGDYTTSCTSAGASCTAAWNLFKPDWDRIHAAGLPGIWTRGNHDTYAYSFGNLPGVAYGSDLSWQAITFDVNTPKGLQMLGLVGVSVADDLSASQPARTYVDEIIAGSQAQRQWMFLRHVGPAEPYGDVTQRMTSPNGGDSGVWRDPCAGYGGASSAMGLLNNFFATVTRVFWFATGHYSYGAAVVQVTANDGHLISGIGNNGNDGGDGHVTMFKFQPSLGQVQIAHYLIGDSATAAGSMFGSVHTTAWAEQTTVAPGQSRRPPPGRPRRR